MEIQINLYTIIIGLLALFVFYFIPVLLQVSYQKSKNKTVGYITAFFWLKAVFITFCLIAIFGPFNLLWKVYLFIIGLTILAFTLIPLSIFACDMWFPRFKKISIIIWSVGAIILFLTLITNVHSISLPVKLNLDFLIKVAGPFGSWYTLISHLIGMVAIGLIIVISGLKLTEKRLMFRSVLLGLGMFLAGVSGSLLVWFNQPSLLIALGTVNTIGHFAMVIGILIRPQKRQLLKNSFQEY